VNQTEIELSVGQSLHIEGYCVTVLDIVDDEIHFRVEDTDDWEGGPPSPQTDFSKPR